MEGIRHKIEHRGIAPGAGSSSAAWSDLSSQVQVAAAEIKVHEVS